VASPLAPVLLWDSSVPTNLENVMPKHNETTNETTERRDETTEETPTVVTAEKLREVLGGMAQQAAGRLTCGDYNL
jgi:hypothetical protein